MAPSSSIRVYKTPPGIATNKDFTLAVRSKSHEAGDWSSVGIYAVQVSEPNAASNIFRRHTIAVASVDFDGLTEFRLSFNADQAPSFAIRPRSYNIKTTTDSSNRLYFVLEKPRDVMIEVNGNKWQALHILSNAIDHQAPTTDTPDTWYFGPGINQGSAYNKVLEGDGVNLFVPSGKTIYLAGGAFITCRLNFVDVSNCAVRGHGFILGPQGGYVHREHGGAIHMSGATSIEVQGVTSLNSNGFTLSAGQCKNVHIDRYRAFSSAGNGDGIDFFCSSNIVIENCFLRTSDDCIALYSHRWDWYGDTTNVDIRHCVLLPDMAHAINVGTHGNPEKPETMSNIRVSDTDVLDHEENQQWYQGVIALNAGDMNTLEDFTFENIRVERITRGQLVNIRVMQNAMWTMAPGVAVRNVKFRNVSLDTDRSKVVNPSMILGYDKDRPVENVSFENLKIGDRVVHTNMEKPRWYMVSDFIPLFANEHVRGLEFIEAVE
ncbi:unnamed protein product [Clonostachys rosea f. rosea IK726]|uniref:Uncharacterized protein n=1 Tax=Clonostachys rosea f. rosea IK726 TaxID=1349383 RepID=A0ACA9UBD2_BIOOC|nr:unnamed protein product [Clonostachys rosea f. rosea IK726]